jgi:hypothetical protein
MVLVFQNEHYRGPTPQIQKHQRLALPLCGTAPTKALDVGGVFCQAEAADVFF